MIKIQIPEEEKETLTEGHKNGKKKYFRDRCQCILMLSEGFTVKELSRIFKTRTRTIYEWVDRYKLSGFLGLKIKSGRGLKSILKTINAAQEAAIKTQVELNPQSLRGVCTVLSTEFGFTITKPMLKNYLKKS